jgi:hypothetical protein
VFRPARRRWSLIAGIAAVAAGLVVIAVVMADDDPQQQTAVGDDPGLVHVHGLGIDPLDGTLLAATHHGLFRVPADGRPTRVGDRRLDLMGFTVADPGRFLASGHPEITDEELRLPDKPPLLGLVESTDGGASWQPLSLLGEADFHALTYAHRRVHGHDATSGRFLVSADGRQWEERSTLAAPLTAVAVSPTDPDRVVAATGDGHLVSDDGGHTWAPGGQVALAALAWDARADELWGVSPDGTLWASTDGSAWTQQGRVDGRIEALYAADGELWTATTQGIFHSVDGAATWSVLHRPSS